MASKIGLIGAGAMGTALVQRGCFGRHCVQRVDCDGACNRPEAAHG